MLGVVFAAAGAGAMLAGWWWAAAVCVQLRLLCNMMDGLIAVEHGKGDKLGGFFNEVPDRVEDVLLLLAAGYAAGGVVVAGEGGATLISGPMLGWAAALLALGTAYLRQTGVAMGLAQDYCGPLAKPQRMFFLTLALLVAGGVEIARRAACEGPLYFSQSVLRLGLAIIVCGTAITVVRRTVRMANNLRAR